MPFRTDTMLMLLAIGVAGWVMLFFGNPWGFSFILMGEGYSALQITRFQLEKEPEPFFKRPDLMVLWLLFGLMIGAALAWTVSQRNAIIILIVAEIAASCWVFEKKLYPLQEI